MELLDQYLKTIKTFLPKGQQDDIIRELSENLISQMEDKEAELGRPLTEAEQEAVLQQHGNPMVVAGRYQQQGRSVAFGRQLIGPMLFPLYLRILSLNLGFTAAVILTIGFATGRGFEFSSLLLNCFIQFAILTIIFTLAEKHLLKSKDRWDPKDFGSGTKGKAISVVWRAAFSTYLPGNGESKVSRSESIALIIFNLVFVSWWITIPAYMGRALLNGAGAILRLGPGCEVLYLPILFLAVAGFVQPCVNLFRPQWVWLRDAWRTASAAIFTGILCLSLKAGNWVVLADASDKLAQHQRAIEVINQWCSIGITIGAVVSGVIFLMELRRLLHRRSNHEMTATRANGMQLS
ncbi:MAG TPA: hypothetical protein VNV88_13615 [Candidatus Solibacter sp.]|jgi:hypothetical protein|nr:hypothetical protein [Candidatus Solibacter sp.]